MDIKKTVTFYLNLPRQDYYKFKSILALEGKTMSQWFRNQIKKMIREEDELN
jgi:hypothetical protein